MRCRMRRRLSHDSVRFEVAAYDRSQPLVIDPCSLYSTYLGGADDDAFGIAVDSAGNAYVTGWTRFERLPDHPGGVRHDNWRNLATPS